MARSIRFAAGTPKVKKGKVVNTENQNLLNEALVRHDWVEIETPFSKFDGDIEAAKLDAYKVKNAIYALTKAQGLMYATHVNETEDMWVVSIFVAADTEVEKAFAKRAWKRTPEEIEEANEESDAKWSEYLEAQATEQDDIEEGEQEDSE